MAGRDLGAHEPTAFVGGCASELMRHRFVTLSPATSLLEAAQLLQLARLRYVPVVRAGLLVGLLSNQDVQKRSLDLVPRFGGAELRRLLSRLAVDSLVEEAATVLPETPLADAGQRLIEDGRGCLPVVVPVSPGLRLVGLLTDADLLRAAYAFAAPTLNH